MTRTHEDRIGVARSAVDYIIGRTEEEMARPVPNCPGWTVRNAAVHVARVCHAWGGMMQYPPEDADARDKAYAETDRLPEGADADQLRSWAHGALDAMTDDDRPCYFSMTGGPGSTGLWAWHAASEIGVHRLDVEAALEHEPSLTDAEATDSVDYACRFFMPAMRRVTGRDPGRLTLEVLDDEDLLTRTVTLDAESASDRSVIMQGPARQLLLAVWGRPYEGVELVAGDPAVLDGWRALPGEAFQFGAWD